MLLLLSRMALAVYVDVEVNVVGVVAVDVYVDVLCLVYAVVVYFVNDDDVVAVADIYVVVDYAVDDVVVVVAVANVGVCCALALDGC